MTSPPPTVFSVLRARVRRGQLIVGVGGFSATLGAVLAAPVVMALLPWIQKGASPWLAVLVHTLLSRFWVYATLPVLWFVLSRWLTDLKPWPTAVGSALVGELFFVLLDWVGGTLGSVIRRPELWGLRLLTLGLGIFLSARAIAWRRVKPPVVSQSVSQPTVPDPPP